MATNCIYHPEKGEMYWCGGTYQLKTGSPHIHPMFIEILRFKDGNHTHQEMYTILLNYENELLQQKLVDNK